MKKGKKGRRSIGKAIKKGFEVCKRAGIPLYWSKYSKKKYTIHQHLMILVLSAVFGWSVERTIDYIWEDEYLMRLLNLQEVPHKSTLSRFKMRIPARWFLILFKKINEMVGGSRGRFVIDSTGLRMSNPSYYYTQKIGEIVSIKECLKLHTALDVDTGIVASARVTLFRVHDTRILIPLLEDIDYLTELYADKGYDSTQNIMYVQSRGALPYIAIKYNARRGVRKRLLRAMESSEWKKKYGKRNRIESSYHSLKSYTRDYVYAKSLRSAIISSYFKVLAYNLLVLFLTPFFILSFPCFLRNSTYPDGRKP